MSAPLEIHPESRAVPRVSRKA